MPPPSSGATDSRPTSWPPWSPLTIPKARSTTPSWSSRAWWARTMSSRSTATSRRRPRQWVPTTSRPSAGQPRGRSQQGGHQPTSSAWRRCTGGGSGTSNAISIFLARQIEWLTTAPGCGICPMQILFLTLTPITRRTLRGSSATSVPTRPARYTAPCDASGRHCRQRASDELQGKQM